MPNPASVEFREPWGPAIRRGRRRARRTMPTFTRRPVVSLVVWAALVVGVCEFAYRVGRPDRDHGSVVAVEMLAIVGLPALLFVGDVCPARIRLTRRVISGRGTWMLVTHVERLDIKCRGDATLLRVKSKTSQRMTAVVPARARQAVADYVAAARRSSGAVA